MIVDIHSMRGFQSNVRFTVQTFRCQDRQNHDRFHIVHIGAVSEFVFEERGIHNWISAKNDGLFITYAVEPSDFPISQIFSEIFVLETVQHSLSGCLELAGRQIENFLDLLKAAAAYDSHRDESFGIRELRDHFTHIFSTFESLLFRSVVNRPVF
jgi:hypothetical protein